MKQSLKFQSTTMVVQTTGIIAADIDGEKAMMSIEKGKYYGLDAVGSLIWGLIDKPVSVQQIVTALMEKYDIDANTCQQDVYIFLDKMHAERLVAIV